MTASGVSFVVEMPFFITPAHATYNGTAFTKEAVERVIPLLKDTPVVSTDGRVIGVITNPPKEITWPYGERETGLCFLKCKGYLLGVEPELCVHQQNEHVITDFSFNSICFNGFPKEKK